MARGAYRAVDQRPDPVSKFNLGVRMEERGDFAAAERAYRHADERGHAAAAVNLGVLLEDRGEVAEAEAAYRRAQKRGDPNGAFNLGVLLEERGDGNGAVRCYRFADQKGHAAAACNLGAILAEQGDVSGAEAAFKRADERGDSNAAFNLAALLSTLTHPEPAQNGSLNGAPAAEGPALNGVASPTISRLDEERGSRAGFGRRRGDSHATVRSSRRGRRRGGALTGRRVALVLVPILLVLAGAIAWGSSLTRVPKHAVDSAATVRPTQPTTTASTIADAPAATPPPAARHSAKAAPKHRAAHVKAAARTKRPSTASTHHIVVARHVAAPTIAPRPTYVATRVAEHPRSEPRGAEPSRAKHLPLRARHLARHSGTAPPASTGTESLLGK